MAPPPGAPAPRSSVPLEAEAPQAPAPESEEPTVQPQADGEAEDEFVLPAAVDGADVVEPGPDGEGAPAPAPKAGVAPVVQGDWLASVCPYLASDDGTYRSAAPDEGHRCTAQDPAAALPLAFQERYCLTDRHPRCEMYKFAQETDSSGAIPVAQVPPTDPPTPRTSRASGGGSSRPLIMAGAGIGIVVLIVVLVLLVGSCGGGSGVDPEATTDAQATEAPADASEATPEPTPESTPPPTPEPTPEPDPEATPDEAAVDAGDAAAVEITIQYEVQQDEALLKISETFGITRNRIRRENPGLEDVAPVDLPGTVIELPIVGDMTLEEAQALPGYVGIAP